MNPWFVATAAALTASLMAFALTLGTCGAYNGGCKANMARLY